MPSAGWSANCRDAVDGKTHPSLEGPSVCAGHSQLPVPASEWNGQTAPGTILPPPSRPHEGPPLSVHASAIPSRWRRVDQVDPMPRGSLAPRPPSVIPTLHVRVQIGSVRGLVPPKNSSVVYVEKTPARPWTLHPEAYHRLRYQADSHSLRPSSSVHLPPFQWTARFPQGLDGAHTCGDMRKSPLHRMRCSISP